MSDVSSSRACTRKTPTGGDIGTGSSGGVGSSNSSSPNSCHNNDNNNHPQNALLRLVAVHLHARLLGSEALAEAFDELGGAGALLLHALLQLRQRLLA